MYIAATPGICAEPDTPARWGLFLSLLPGRTAALHLQDSEITSHAHYRIEERKEKLPRVGVKQLSYPHEFRRGGTL